MSARSILVAGIGNVFLGDDGFGVEVARRLAVRSLPPQVEVKDFGIRGLDLAYALLEEEPGLTILVDAAQRGFRPGTIHVLEPDGAEWESANGAEPEPHGMAPTRAIAMAKAMGAKVGRLRVVCCEPETFGSPETGAEGLSEPVRWAVEEAVQVVLALIENQLETPCTSSR
jgi:hydrogenase maturation protease